MASINQRRHMNAPLDGPVCYEKPTGYLTRFVPARPQHSKFYDFFMHLTRVLEFLSFIIPLGIFSSHSVSSRSTASSPPSRLAVVSTAHTSWLRWLWVVLDLLVMGAFIAVAVITSTNGSMASPRHCFIEERLSNGSNRATSETANTDGTCNLSWGNFILGIISTLHAITTSFNNVRAHRCGNKLTMAEEEKAVYTTPAYNAPGHVGGAHNGDGPVGRGQVGRAGNAGRVHQQLRIYGRQSSLLAISSF
ncbi:hypothetical protein LZ32DRAFT_618500 [Colletotrichum eremochloae]|nr:hypothetical protein LZ32DRAFT_618500 [Colletotrichum eremochloae]